MCHDNGRILCALLHRRVWVYCKRRKRACDNFCPPNRLASTIFSSSINAKFNRKFTKTEALIQLLFAKLKEVYDVDSPRLSRTHKEMMYNALEALNKSAQKIIVVNIERTFENSDALDAVETDEELIMEGEVVEKYKSFIQSVSENENVLKLVENESMGFVKSIQNLPFLNDPVAVDVYYEPFVMKLVKHIENQIVILPGEKRLDYRCTRSTVWTLRALRIMIGKALYNPLYLLWFVHC